MSFFYSKILALLFWVVLCFAPGKENHSSFYMKSEMEPAKTDSELKGYKDITECEGQYIAVGTDGRIDFISPSGKISHINNTLSEDLNSVYYCDQKIYITGKKGVIELSTNKQTFNKIESGTDKNINSITSFNGNIIAGADQGILLISNNGTTFKTIHLPLKGNITSVSSNESACFGATSEGEIISSSDGYNWKTFDYNKEYSGFYKACSFRCVLMNDKRIAIAGVHDDGSPVLIFSSIGNVWTERLLNYNDDEGYMGLLTDSPNDLSYDNIEDQFIMSCNNGKIMILPSCTKCNKLIKLTDIDLYTITNSENKIIAAGSGFFIKIFNFR
jgi:hypothetical protein